MLPGGSTLLTQGDPDPTKAIMIGHHRTQIDGRVHSVEMGDLLAVLAGRLSWRAWKKLRATSISPLAGVGDDPIDAASLYPCWGGS